MKSHLVRVVAIVLFLVASALGINLLSALILDVKTWIYEPFMASPDRSDPRAKLLVYQNEERARLMFDELFEAGFDYVPFVGWSRREFIGETVTINADGDREHPATTPSPDSVARFFGGSTVWGTGADDCVHVGIGIPENASTDTH